MSREVWGLRSNSRIMRYAYALLVVLLMVITLSHLRAEGKTTIRFWWQERPEFVREMEELIGEFERLNPDIDVKLELTVGWQDKLIVAVAGGAAPDVTILFSGYVRPMAKEELLLDLSSYLPKDYGANFYPPQWSLVTQGTAVYALPFTLTTIAMVYDKNCVEGAGVKVPRDVQDTWNWREFEDSMRKVRSYLQSRLVQGSTGYGFVTPGGDFWMLPWFYQNGSRLLDPSGSKCALNTPEAIETIEFLARMVREKTMAFAGGDLVANGRAGLVISGHWDLNPWLLDQKTGRYLVDCGITFLPRQRKHAVGLGGDYVAVLKTTKHPREATRFVQFLTSKESTSRYASALNYLCPWKGTLPNYRTFRELMPGFYQQATVASTELVMDRAVPNYGMVRDAFMSGLLDAVNGKISPTSALAKIEAQINSALKK